MLPKQFGIQVGYETWKRLQADNWPGCILPQVEESGVKKMMSSEGIKILGMTINAEG